MNRLAKKGGEKVGAVFPQEMLAKITIFQKRGGYELPMIVDQDGQLVEKYGFNSLPAHYFLDRKGQIKEIVSGVLSEEEIKEKLEKSLLSVNAGFLTSI